MNRHPLLEALESRIAPATLVNPLPDVVAGAFAGRTIDLGFMFDADATGAYRTKVEFLTNFDTDAEMPGLQAGKIVLELFDDAVPLTVQNFLYYVQNAASGDYDSTFFHRSIAGFVLQGGGFEVSDLNSHIPTGPYLHNEFSPTRSNLEGTIAMAKTPNSPHTATSEFFINLADNSGHLDEQNGGFTVFGRVIEGMDVVQAIASLPTVNLGTGITQNGALTDTPVQGGYTTAGGIAPTAAQLIQIVDAKIIAPEDGVSDGLTFSAVVATPEGNPTTIASAKITGDMLALNYRPGASGIAKVTVTAKDNTGAIAGVDEFNVTIQPNLVSRVEGDNLYFVVVPGDKGKAKATIWNTAGGTAKGKVKVTFYLSLLDENFEEIDIPNIAIGETLKSINVRPGQATSVTGKVEIPKQLIHGSGLNFRILAEVTSPDGARHISELGDYTDDNLSLDTPAYHQLRNWFGTFQVGDEIRKNVPLTYEVENEQPVKVTLTGGGFGALFLDDEFNVDLVTTDTNASSALTVKAGPGPAPLIRNVELSIGTTPAPIGSVNLAGTTVYGNIVAYGGLKNLTTGRMAGIYEDAVIAIGAFAPNPSQTATIRVGDVYDFNFTSEMPVKSLVAAFWKNSDNVPESLTFTSLGSFTSKSDLEAAVFVTGTSRLKSFTVGGTLGEALVQVNGDVGAVTLGAIRNSWFLVGTTVPEVTAGLNAFTQLRTISSFVVKGVGETYALTDSVIAAANIGTINLRSVNPSSPGDSIFGVIADTIDRYQRANGKLTNLDAAGTPDITGDYVLRIL